MNKHREAIEAFQQGHIVEACGLLDQLLTEQESAELWNDWATMQLATGRIEKAESGFLRALQMEPQYLDATTNLGLLLLGKGEKERGTSLLKKALPLLPAHQQELVRTLLTAAPAEVNSGGSAKRELRILVVSDRLPHFNRSGPDLRLMQILRTLREQGHDVTFIARDGGAPKHYETSLKESGIKIHAADSERLACLGKHVAPSTWLLRDVLNEGRFDVAILAHSFSHGISVAEHYLEAIRRSSPQTRIAILTDELHCGSAANRQFAGDPQGFERAQDRSSRESEIFERADSVIVSGGRDAAALRGGKQNLEVKVVALACKSFASGERWESRSGVLYAGSFDQEDTRESFNWLMNEVWPLIRSKSAEIELMVAGEHVPAELEKKWPGVRWRSGRDFADLLRRARIFVAPHQAGMRTNGILTMLANGLPGVTTVTAAESLELRAGEGVVAVDSPADFAAAVLAIYADQNLWNNLAQKGSELITAEFSPEAVAKQVAAAIAQTSELEPKAAVEDAFSILQVESLYLERLLVRTGEKRITGQLESYVVFAEQLLRENKPGQARDQLRHVFGRLTGSIQAGQFLAQVFALLKRCYRELGEPEMADSCAEAARSCVAGQTQELTQRSYASSGKRRKINEPLISLIVPTYDRLPILKKCMTALEAQTLPPKKFEVIVIDDGSSDGTREFMETYHPPFRFQYLRQNNSGTGAARRNGVAHARGEYLLLMNDDTICDEDVIEQHLRMQRSYPNQRWAVLGNFEYPAAERRRALTHYFCVEPFMFPQVVMEEGCPYGYSHFITCNLSIRRDAVMDAGSFESTYKLSEDTEIGIRLFERGYRILYHPDAHAVHDHLPYVTQNLVRRARVYGADYFHMFRNHPRVMKEWAMPIALTGMDEENATRIRSYIEENRAGAEQAVAALERWDTVEFEPVLTQQPETAAMVLGLFRQAVPAIHWFYLFESMLNTMEQHLDFTKIDSEPMAMHAVQGGD